MLQDGQDYREGGSENIVGLYIDQLEYHLQSHDQDAPQLLDSKVSILLYADDIVLLSKPPSGLQHRLDILQLFCSEKLLTVNMSKTQVVIFNDFRRSHTDSFTYSISNSRLSRSTPAGA